MAFNFKMKLTLEDTDVLIFIIKAIAKEANTSPLSRAAFLNVLFVSGVVGRLAATADTTASKNVNVM